MKQWRVTLSPTVEDQITDQVLFIADHSIDNALAWESRLRTAINNLAETHGYAVDQNASEHLGVEVRKFVFEKNYLVHDQLDSADRVVRVIGFRHGARLPNRGEP